VEDASGLHASGPVQTGGQDHRTHVCIIGAGRREIKGQAALVCGFQ